MGHDVFVYDRKTGALEWVPVEPDRKLGPLGGSGCGYSLPGGISANGRHVAFCSCAEDLVQGDDGHDWDFFVRDRGLPLSVGDLVASGRASRLSLDGAPRFSRTGTAWIDDAVPDALSSKLGQAGELLGARITYRPLLEDIYVVLELESMPRTPMLVAATAGTVFGMSLNIDGKPYEIRSASTGLGPHGETAAEFGLFSCGVGRLLCTKVANLKGGFGTTGERITISVPLDDLGIEDDSVISKVKAYTSLGTFLGGALQIVDEASL